MHSGVIVKSNCSWPKPSDQRLRTAPAVLSQLETQTPTGFHPAQFHYSNHGFFMPQVTFSDHLPLVCDFEIQRPEANQKGSTIGKPKGK